MSECSRCGKKNLSPDGVHTCTPKVYLLEEQIESLQKQLETCYADGLAINQQVLKLEKQLAAANEVVEAAKELMPYCQCIKHGIPYKNLEYTISKHQEDV